jgi:hypothetical protein
MGYDELTVLSLDAAIELDRILGGEDADANVISRFIGAIQSNGIVCRQGTANYLADPRTADLYARALTSATGNSIGSIDQLNDAVLAVAAAYKDAGTLGWNKSLSALRDFCLALHSVLIADTLPHAEEPVPAGGIWDARAAF